MIVVADECPLIRIGLVKIINNEDLDNEVVEVDNIESLKLLIYQKKLSIIFFGLNNDFEDFLECMSSEKDYFNDIKVIVLENRIDYSIFKAARNIGIYGYLLKNAEIQDIIDALHIILRNKKYFDYDIFTKLDEINCTIDSRLTKRENEIYSLVARGNSNAIIAEKLFISPNTVKKHVSNILTKLQLIDRKQIILQSNNTIIL